MWEEAEEELIQAQILLEELARENNEQTKTGM